jgi:hypothetical protein
VAVQVVHQAVVALVEVEEEETSVAEDEEEEVEEEEMRDLQLRYVVCSYYICSTCRLCKYVKLNVTYSIFLARYIIEKDFSTMPLAFASKEILSVVVIFCRSEQHTMPYLLIGNFH